MGKLKSDFSTTHMRRYHALNDQLRTGERDLCARLLGISVQAFRGRLYELLPSAVHAAEAVIANRKQLLATYKPVKDKNPKSSRR